MIFSFTSVAILNLSPARADNQSEPETYYLGDTIPHNQPSFYTYYFGGICKTSAGTYVMTMGFRDYNNAASCSFDFYIEVSVNATVNIGHQPFKIISFTTDSINMVKL
jgi:hypothetical protein